MDILFHGHFSLSRRDLLKLNLSVKVMRCQCLRQRIHFYTR
jgi:hypothetical protein